MMIDGSLVPTFTFRFVKIMWRMPSSASRGAIRAGLTCPEHVHWAPDDDPGEDVRPETIFGGL